MESDMNSYNQYEDFFWKENMSLKSPWNIDWNVLGLHES